MATAAHAYKIVMRLIREEIPDFETYPKRTSKLHRFIGWACNAPWFGKRRVNPGYMTSFYTTFNGKTAYPINSNPITDWDVFPHEFIHLKQEKKWTAAIFQPLYLLGIPVYTVVAAALAVLGIPLWIWVAPWWTSLVVLGAGVLLSSPVPFGYWRGRWELQAYAVSIALQYWLKEEVTDDYLEWSAHHFTSSDYFWMYPYGRAAYRKLEKARGDTISGEIFKNKQYGEFLVKLHRELLALKLTSIRYKLDA